MKILFFIDSLETGGVETFMLRLSKSLANKNYQSIFIVINKKYNSYLYNEISKNSKIIFLDDYIYLPKFITKKIPSIFKLFFSYRLSEKINIGNISHVHITDIKSLLFFNKTANDLNIKNVPISLGVYHINEYKINKYKKYYFVSKIIKQLEQINFVFFNEICKHEYENYYQNNNKSFLCPLGIEFDENNKLFYGNQNNKIVSIGRLTQWKTYNFQMIYVIEELNKQNIFLQFESYGDGEMRESLQNLVNEKGLKSQIKFHPQISYDKIDSKLVNTLLFIGAGTALIEASSKGIPSLIGIENLDPKELNTYGYLHDYKTLSYQELSLNYPKDKISNYIIELLSCTQNEYLKKCTLAYRRSKDFDINNSANTFIKIANSHTAVLKTFSNKTIFFIVLSMLKYKVKNFFSKETFFKRL